MKKHVLYGLMLSAGALVLAGCSDDLVPGSKTKGKIAPRISLNTEVTNALPTPSRASAMGISVSDLKLRLTPQGGKTSPKEWNSVDEFNTNEEFTVGAYTLEAFYGDLNDEGFNKPYYHGLASLTVNENEVTNVSLPVALANTMVTVKSTDAFMGYFADAEYALLSAGSTTEVTYPVSASDAAYMKPGEITLYADVTKPNGQSARVEAARFNADPKCHYTVTVDVNNGQVGEAVMVITFSDDLDGVETVEIELNDELFTTPAPSISISGYDSDQNYNYISGVLPEGLAPELIIKAPGSISSIRMTSNSAWLTSKSVADDIDLIAMPEASYTKLKNLGIQGEYHRVDKYARINLTELLRNIQYMPNADSNETKFAFVVVDKNSKASEPVYIVVDIDKLDANIASVGGLGFGSSELDMVVAYNGSNFDRDVKIQYYNDRGTWSNASYTVSSVSRASANYYLHVSGLPAEGDAVELRILLGEGSDSQVVETKSVPRSDLKITALANNVFARHAIVSVVSSTFNIPDNLSFTANGSPVTTQHIAGTNDFKLIGLTPDSKLKIATVVEGITVVVNIVTEAATPLQNGDMEAWSKGGSGSNWELMIPEGWGTNNPMTTSQGSDFAYVRISGTTNTEVNKTITKGNNNKLSDAQCAPHSGNNAAIIQTVGWGSGNTATGSKGTSGTCKYIDAGLLHIGASRSTRVTDLISTADLDCGLDFASRPSNLSFWYKYFPRNSQDKGYVEIWVKDASGNVIASNTATLDSSSEYAEKTISLTYPAGAPKGAKIYVKFLSTYSADFLQRNDQNLVGPGFGNLNRGTFMGSQLVVDDITLNY